MNNTTESSDTTFPFTNTTKAVTKLWPRGGPFVDPSYYVLPQDTVDVIKKVCYLGICPLLLVAGIGMNIICLVMFLRLVKSSKTSTVTLLLALTIADIFYILMATVHVLLISSGYYGIPFTKNQRIQAIPYFHGFLQIFPGKFLALLTMIISFERLYCVIQPLKIRQYSTKKNALLLILVAFALTFIFNFPFAFVNKSQEMYSNFTGTYYIVVPTEFGKNEELFNTIYLVNETLFSFIPFIGVTVSCGIIIGVLFVSDGKRTHMTPAMASSQTTERNATRTLMSLIFLFIVCKAPATILSIIINIHMEPFEYSSNVYEVAIVIAFIPILFKSVMNLFIFYKTSTVYRAHIAKIFGCTTQGKKTQKNTANVFTKKCDLGCTNVI